MSQHFIFLADLFGTVVFAITGAVCGMKLRLDLLGVVVFGCLVGVGGGMVRDTIIGATPVAALQNETYLNACIVTGLVVFCFFKHIINHRAVIGICDAVGLGIFTALGAAKGTMYNLGAVGMILCGVLSAVGGGILRDVMARRIPAVLVSDFYATASLIGGVIYIFLKRLGIPDFYCFIVTASVVTLIRLAAMQYHFHLPGARRPLAAGKRR